MNQFFLVYGGVILIAFILGFKATKTRNLKMILGIFLGGWVVGFFVTGIIGAIQFFQIKDPYICGEFAQVCRNMISYVLFNWILQIVYFFPTAALAYGVGIVFVFIFIGIQWVLKRDRKTKN